MAVQRQRIGGLDQLAANGARLIAKGLVSEIDRSIGKVRWNSNARAISLDQQMAKRQANLSEIRFNLDQLRFTQGDKIQGCAMTSQHRATHRRNQWTPRLHRSRADRRPVSLLQASVGQQADPRRMQLQIVPTDSPLQAELFIPASAIGFVEAGQDVRILYDAFPYQRFGTYRGRIVEVSQTVLMDGDLVAPVKVNQPVYTATVALDRPNVDVRGRKVPLQPDMSLRADIILERRSIMDWIVGPLRHIGLQ